MASPQTGAESAQSGYCGSTPVSSGPRQGRRMRGLSPDRPRSGRLRRPSSRAPWRPCEAGQAQPSEPRFEARTECATSRCYGRADEHLMAHLLRKALNATPKGGALEVWARWARWARWVEGDAVKVWVGEIPEVAFPQSSASASSTRSSAPRAARARSALGRSLCRAIAEAPHGSVSVESTVGAGSTCTGESSRAELLAASAPPAPAARDLRPRALHLLRGRHLRGPRPLRLRCRLPILALRGRIGGRAAMRSVPRLQSRTSSPLTTVHIVGDICSRRPGRPLARDHTFGMLPAL
jgi:hypothetical protein